MLPAYPTAPEVLAALGEEEGKAHRKAFDQAVAANPEDAPLRLAAARAALADQDVAGAETHATAGLALAPWNSELAGLLLSTSMAQSRCEEAATRLSRYESLLPERLSDETKTAVEALRVQVGACGKAKP
jgi:hypothetical protein